MADSQHYKNGREKDRSLKDSLNNGNHDSINSADGVNNLSNNIAGIKSHKHNSDKDENYIHDNSDKINHQPGTRNPRAYAGKSNSSQGGTALMANEAKAIEGRQKDIDELDIKLLNLLQRGFDNKQISRSLNNPLSTIQRRTRLIFERRLAASRIEPDYAKIGLKKGFLVIRLKGGKIPQIVERLRKLRGIISISANIGSFPILCTIVYRDTTELWDIISNVQEQDNVREVAWSEEIYNVSTEYNVLHTPVYEKKN